MKTIYKYLIKKPVQDLVTHAGAEYLKVEKQGDVMCLWALVDTAAPNETITIRTIGTGEEIEDKISENMYHIGTAQDGDFVWHFFKDNE